MKSDNSQKPAEGYKPELLESLSHAHILFIYINYECWNFNSGNYLFTTDTK